MPRLNKRELTLVFTFAALAVAALLIIAFLQTRKWWNQSKVEQASLSEQIQTAEFWLEQHEAYTAKQQWLDENLQPLASRNEATSEFLSVLQEAAKKHSIEIKQQSIIDPENNEPIIKIRLELICAIKPLIQWMNQVQKPSDMIAAPEIEIKAIPKSDNLSTTVVMEKYFKAGS